MLNSEQFSNLFLTEEEKQNRFIFNDNTAVGFSIIKNYPETGLIFQPLKNQKEEDDAVALIKIYFVLNQIDENGKCPLYVWISPSSKYLLAGHFRYNYEDQDSPSAKDLEVWQKAPKPPELSEDSYIFDTNTNKVINKDNNQNVNPKDIIGRIFKEHLKTAKRFRGLPFRLKLNTRDFLGNKPLYLCKIISSINKAIFSREVNKDTRSYDSIAYELFLKPIPHGLLRISQPRELKIFGTELPVSKNSVIITPFIFIIFSIIVHLWFPRIEGGLNFLIKDNTFLATSVVVAWFVIFDSWLPHTLLFASNRIVAVADWFRRKKILV